MSKNYTDEQLKWLIDNYYDATWEEIFLHFPDKNKKYIHQLASKNGIKRNRYNPRIENLEDIIGRKFGRLTVISYIGYIPKNRHMYLCKCDCGNCKEITRNSLIKGSTKSCGCLHDEQLSILNQGRTNFEKTHINNIRKHYKSSAKTRGIKFDLEYDDIKKIVVKRCYYCGLEYSNISKGRSDGNKCGVFYYNGIDRIDSNKGYTKDNIVPCCKFCNIAKNTMSQYEFYNLVQRIHSYYTKDKIVGKECECKYETT